ncbi:MAG: DNA-3-methyladenine glycosylase [Thalassobaculales bacterium]
MVHRLDQALAALADSDPRLAAALAEVGPPDPRWRPPGFATLFELIVEQQVSVLAAKAIWKRLEAGLGEVTPATVGACTLEELRGFGLSLPKARYGLILAGEVAAGRLDLDRLPGLDDAAALAALTAVKGIGRWTAEVYLMFVDGRGDIWPAHDVALQAAVGRLLGLAERPSPKAMDGHAEAWRPWRSAAALLLWRYYAATKAAARSRG